MRRPLRMPSQMKAAVLTRYGAPDVLEMRDVPAPVPGDNEVLVCVRASTVCFGDRMIRSGPLLVRLMNGLRRPKTTILGVDLAGTVVAIGKNVTRFAPGDLVFGSRGEKLDRKSTRLNSSHSQISYAVFCLKKKTN